jgi:hypothetical protein
MTWAQLVDSVCHSLNHEVSIQLIVVPDSWTDGKLGNVSRDRSALEIQELIPFFPYFRRQTKAEALRHKVAPDDFPESSS